MFMLSFGFILSLLFFYMLLWSHLCSSLSETLLAQTTVAKEEVEKDREEKDEDTTPVDPRITGSRNKDPIKDVKKGQGQSRGRGQVKEPSTNHVRPRPSSSKSIERPAVVKNSAPQVSTLKSAATSG